jgi:hypothetical protein
LAAVGLVLIGAGLWDVHFQGLIAAKQAAVIADQLDPPVSESPDGSMAAELVGPTFESEAWSTDFQAYDDLIAAHADEYGALFKPGSWEAWGVLEVPAWADRKDPIFGTVLTGRMPIAEGSAGAGVRDPVLDQAFASHYTASQGPGEVGNFGLAGHRRSRGNTFLFLPELKTGDEVFIATPLARLRYVVNDDDRHHYVSPDDSSPLAPVPGDWGAVPPAADEVLDGSNRVLTLQTCTNLNGGPWNNTHRWYVHATLTGWMPR